MPLSQQLLWYNSSVGQRTGCTGPRCDQNSGAYIFRPKQNSNGTLAYSINQADGLPEGTPVALALLTGPVVSEARQMYGNGSWVSSVTRLWAGDTSGWDLQWTVGPIPTGDNLGKEVISLVTTPLDTKAAWWSDSNGRDSVARVRNYRPTWNLTVEEPVSGNFFPVPSFVTCTMPRRE